jgi:hypothetical protein
MVDVHNHSLAKSSSSPEDFPFPPYSMPKQRVVRKKRKSKQKGHKNGE